MKRLTNSLLNTLLGNKRRPLPPREGWAKALEALAKTFDGLPKETLAPSQDLSFEAVNDYVHGSDADFEGLQGMCLSLATALESVRELCAATYLAQRRRLAPFGNDITDRLLRDACLLTEIGYPMRAANCHEAVDEIRMLRNPCAAAYQALGAVDDPVEMLDNLSDAANGHPLRHDPGAGLPFGGADAELKRDDGWRSILQDAIDALQIADHVAEPGHATDSDHKAFAAAEAGLRRLLATLPAAIAVEEPRHE